MCNETTISYEDWLDELAEEFALLGGKVFSVDDLDKDAWRAYYDDCFTPRAAIMEDASYD